MRKLAKKNYSIKREVVSKDKAISIFEDRKEPYKIELLKEIKDSPHSRKHRFSKGSGRGQKLLEKTLFRMGTAWSGKSCGPWGSILHLRLPAPIYNSAKQKNNRKI